MLSHLGSLIPGQRLTKRPGQLAHGVDDGRANGLCTVAGQWRAVLDPLPPLISLLARQVQQHREARAAFDESADRRAVQAKDEITFPMPRDRPVFDRRWPFTDHDGIAQEGLSTAAGPLHAEHAELGPSASKPSAHGATPRADAARSHDPWRDGIFESDLEPP